MQSAKFFDPETMFGIVPPTSLSEGGKQGGFDVVIGNPPYVSAVSMARTKEEKVYFKINYPEATGSYDIYVLFLLKAVNLINNSGIYCWIIPNKFLIADYAIKTKDKLLKNGLNISIDVSIFNVFENAGVYPIIILGNRTNKVEFKEYLLDNYSDLEKRIFTLPTKLKRYTSFSDLGIKFSSGATGFEAESLKQYLTETEVLKSIPFTVSGCIDRYYQSNRKVRFMGLKLQTAFIRFSKNIASSKWQFWNNEKIVIAGMTKVIESVYVKTPLALGVGVYAIYDFNGINPYLLNAILNSKYLTYYINIQFKDKHLAGGYLAINKSILEKLPLLLPSNDIEMKISDIAKNITQLKQHNPLTDTSQLEKQIDEMVYKLYELTDEEIKIIEGHE
jgi:hypothetical protein